METKVQFSSYQEVPASDLNAMQDLTQSSIDNVVRYTLFDERKFAGLNVTKSSSNAVDVATGKGFYLGKVYNKADATTHSLTSLQPTSGYRIILAVVTLDEVATGEAVRKFLVDATTRQTQPKPVSTRKARVASVDFIAGTQSGSPVAPAVPAGYLAFAKITMSASGVTDIDMMVENRVTKLEDVIDVLETVNDILDEHEAQFKTLRNDLASIRSDIKAMPISRDLESIQEDLLNMREALSVPDLGTMKGLDNFVEDDESDLSHPAYDALVHRGLQFKPAAEKVKIPNLLTTNDAGLLIDPSGLILPKPSPTLAIRLNAKTRTGPQSDIVTADFASHGRSFKRQLPARNYWYYGTGSHAQEEAKLRQRTGVKLYNPASQQYEIIKLKDRDWKLENVNAAAHFYRIVSDEPYWDMVLEGELVGSYHVAQTWYEATGGWYSEMAIGVTQKDPSANIRLYITEVAANGEPIDDRAIVTTTIANADVKIWVGTTPVWTTGKFTPFYLVPGRRYALFVSTPGSYKYAAGSNDSGDANNISRSGTLWTSLDGISMIATQSKDLCMQARAFQWTTVQRYVALDGIELAQGINRLQAVLSGFEPSGCNITLQAQVGGKWRNIDEKDATVLNSNPTVVPMRMVITGTTSTQPGIYLNQSAILAQNPKTSATHISTRRTTDVPAKQVLVQMISHDFAETKHDLNMKLLIGAAYATEVSPAKMTSTTKSGRTVRSWTFNVTNLSDYKMKTMMGATDTNDSFSIARREDTAIAA